MIRSSSAAVRTAVDQPATASTRAVALLATFAMLTIAGLYVARVVAVPDPDAEATWRAIFLRETGLLERVESLLWLVAVAIAAGFSVTAFRRQAFRCWAVFLLCLSAFALGEESGWGQHLFGFDPRGWLAEHNVQGDVTLHNLDFAPMLGLPANSPAGAALAWSINVAPYLLCLGLWIALPLAQWSGRFPRLGSLPLPGSAVVGLFAASTILYVVIDVAVADVAEIFELAIAMTFALAIADLSGRASLHESGGTR